MGFVQTYGQALACRTILAFSESPFWGTMMLLLSRHYTRAEVGTRVACVFVGEFGANAIVGLCVLRVTGPG